MIPLNEECGLLEWVQNTHGLRNILTKIYKYVFFPLISIFLYSLLYFIPFDLEMSCSFLIVFFMQHSMNVTIQFNAVTRDTKLQATFPLHPHAHSLIKLALNFTINVDLVITVTATSIYFNCLSVCQTVSFSPPAFLSTCLYVSLSVYVLV